MKLPPVPKNELSWNTGPGVVPFQMRPTTLTICTTAPPPAATAWSGGSRTNGLSEARSGLDRIVLRPTVGLASLTAGDVTGAPATDGLVVAVDGRSCGSPPAPTAGRAGGRVDTSTTVAAATVAT